MRSSPWLSWFPCAFLAVVAGCGGGASTSDCGTETGTGCKPASQRVDLVEPTFSAPTEVSNPLFPIRDLQSAVLLGNVDGHLLRVETTLLPRHETVSVRGQAIETLLSQYVAYLDGRIEEVALDRYAQSDDGAVWYLGEDVFNYAGGEVADTEGTWLAGRNGPVAMIMPAEPKVGDVYRPENSPGIVFEEVTIEQVDVTVDGPSGPVAGAIVGQELHQDGSLERKTFAPGYGEFASGAGGDVEALAVAVPADALSDPPPDDLAALFQGAIAIDDAARAEDWAAVVEQRDAMAAAWDRRRAAGGLPELLEAQMTRALGAMNGDALTPAVDARNPAGSARAALGVATATLDFQLRYRPVTEVDRARFGLWARHLVLDASLGEPGGVAGDVTCLEWIRDRIAHTLDPAAAAELDTRLRDLRAAASDGDLEAVSTGAAELRTQLAGLGIP